MHAGSVAACTPAALPAHAARQPTRARAAPATPHRPALQAFRVALAPPRQPLGAQAAYLNVQEQRQDEDGGDGCNVEREPHDVNLLREQLAARGEAGRVGLRAEQARRLRPPWLLCGRCE